MSEEENSKDVKDGESEAESSDSDSDESDFHAGGVFRMVLLSEERKRVADGVVDPVGMVEPEEERGGNDDEESGQQPSASSSSSNDGPSETSSIGGGRDAANDPDSVEPTLGRTRQQIRSLLQQR